MELENALGQFLLQLEADGRSHHTRDQYRRHVGLLSRYLGEKDLEEITHRDLARFLTSDEVRLRADGAPRKPTSANTIRSSLRTFFGYIHAAGFVAANAARLVRRARCSSGPPRALSAAEQERLLAALDGAESEAEKRDRALFRLLLGTGTRISEALLAQVEDLDLQAGELRIRHQKGGGEGMVYLPRAVVEILGEYLGDRRSGWIFLGQGSRPLGCRQAARRFSMWLARAGIQRAYSPHSCRHSYATTLYRRTGDLLLVQQALRHRAISSSVVYAQCDQQRVRDALGV